jgi:hypothetical protein
VHDPGTVDVTVTNVDQDGNQVGSETVTLVNAYTFKRPDLTEITTLQRVVRTMLQDLKRQVLENISLTTHTDFDSTTSDNLDIVELSTLPGIALFGPRLTENRFYTRNEPLDFQPVAGQYDRVRPPACVDLTFTLVGAADSMTELLNLQNIVVDYFQRNPWLIMDKDESDPSAGTVQYELDTVLGAGMSVGSAPNVNNVRHFTGDFVIRGVEIESSDMTVNRSFALVDFVPTGSVDGPRAHIEWAIEQYSSE